MNFLGFVIATPCMNWFIITQKIKYAFIFLSPSCFLFCNYGDHTTFHPNWGCFESERDVTNNYTKTTGTNMNRPGQNKCMILIQNVHFILRMLKWLQSFKIWDSVLKWNILSSFNWTHFTPLIFSSWWTTPFCFPNFTLTFLSVSWVNPGLKWMK